MNLAELIPQFLAQEPAVASAILSVLVILLALIVFRAVERRDANALRHALTELTVDVRRTHETLFQLRGEQRSAEREGRQEQVGALRDLAGTLQTRLAEITSLQMQELSTTRQGIETRLDLLREENSRQLERMRVTVDEQLQGTLEKRLGDSFKHVSERLEQVHRGLGEMHQLAQGVGDLKRVLTNVKTRGGWGEIQLGTLLEQMLAPEQFARNVKVLPTADTAVEFAIRLPGRSDEPVWLPIDAKFPLEDYQRLSDAREAADPLSEELASRSLTARFTQCAKEISEKYIHPPHTTDFALMFLPTEGLYGEAARSPDLLDRLQQRHRVIVAGPVTFAALLNSLQIGFRTVAIEQRSSEVWALLGAVKTEFAKFGSVLEKVKKNLDQASNTLDGASTRTRAIERKLRKVEEVPWDRAERLIEQDDEPPLESSG